MSRPHAAEKGGLVPSQPRSATETRPLPPRDAAQSDSPPALQARQEATGRTHRIVAEEEWSCRHGAENPQPDASPAHHEAIPEHRRYHDAGKQTRDDRDPPETHEPPQPRHPPPPG